VSRMLRHFHRAICSPTPNRNMPAWALKEWDMDWERGCSADGAQHPGNGW